MLLVSLICLAALILIPSGILLFSRILFELTAAWGPERWQAALRVCGSGNWFEGYGSIQQGGGTLGMKLGGVRLIERRIEHVWRLGWKGFQGWKRRERKGKETVAVRERFPLYWGVGKRVLGAFREPSVSMEGTYSFPDPSVTGQVAGLVYGARAAAQEAFPCSRWDLHPDFEGGHATGSTRISFSLRTFRLLHPCLWYLRGVWTEKQGEERKKTTEGGLGHG